jgi:hypothetical protein
MEVVGASMVEEVGAVVERVGWGRRVCGKGLRALSDVNGGSCVRMGQSRDSGNTNWEAQDQFPLLLCNSLSAPATQKSQGGGIFS